MKILIVGHGEYAKGIKSCIKYLINLDEEIIAIDYEENESFEDFQTKVESEVTIDENLIVFIDVMGGATFKGVSKAILEEESLNKFIVAGVSVSCILEILMNTVVIKEYSDIRGKIDKAIKNANELVVVLNKGAILYE